MYSPNAKTRAEMKKEKKVEREEKKKEKENKPKTAYWHYCQEKKELLMKDHAGRIMVCMLLSRFE